MIFKNKILLIILLQAVGISSLCFGQNKVIRENKLPSWIERPASAYNPEEYLLTVGTGSTLEEAEHEASVNLATMFQEQVKTSQSLIDDYTQIAESEKSNPDKVARLLSFTRRGSRMSPANVVFLKKYVDASGVTYVLAGINRRETAVIYSEAIADNKVKISEYGLQSQNEKDLLKQLVLIKKALVVAEVNDNLIRQRSLVLNHPYSHDDILPRIERRYRQIKQQCLITLEGRDVPELIFATTAKVMDQEGFTLTTDPAKAQFQVTVAYKSEEAKLDRPDARFAHWFLTIHLLKQRSNNEFITFSSEGRDGGLSYDEAVLRAEFSAHKSITDNFRIFLRNHLLEYN